MGRIKGPDVEYMSEHPAILRARLVRERRHGLVYTPFDPNKKPPHRRPFRLYSATMSSRGGSGSPKSSKGGSSHGGSSKGGSSSKSTGNAKQSVQQLVSYLNNHRVNTLTELCRIERIAATCDNEADARAFQEPMTSAWVYYVTSNQLLVELRGLTRSYPFSGDILQEANRRVRSDPESNRSWNLAWLCLTRMRDDGLISAYAAVEAIQPEMWGTTEPSSEDVDRLAACFEAEWTAAVETMLRHWPSPPTWY